MSYNFFVRKEFKIIHFIFDRLDRRPLNCCFPIIQPLRPSSSPQPQSRSIFPTVFHKVHRGFRYVIVNFLYLRSGLIGWSFCRESFWCRARLSNVLLRKLLRAKYVLLALMIWISSSSSIRSLTTELRYLILETDTFPLYISWAP